MEKNTVVQDINEKLRLRLNEEADSSNRSPYFRDYGRVIHSTAFRRLQGKTQIYPGHHSVIRTRLTHTLEVAELAESLYNQYFQGEDKAEYSYIDLYAIRTICLIHDIGHPPFGHKGDKGLNSIIQDKYGDNHFFEGNAQNFRIVNKLSYRQGKEGQNLTIRVLLGIIKKFQKEEKLKIKKVYFKDNIYREDYLYAELLGEKLGIDNILKKQIRTIECAIMDRADEIAYVTHDLDDAIQNGKFTTDDVINFIKGQMALLPDDFQNKIMQLSPEKKEGELSENNNTEEKRQKLIYYLIGLFIENINVDNIKKDSDFETVEDYLTSGISFEFSDEVEKFRSDLYKEFIYNRFIYTQQVQMYEQKAERVIKQVFEELNSNDKLLPQKYREMIDKEHNMQTRIIVDYISGMTDPYFAEVYNRLFTFQSHNITDEI